MKFEAGKKGMGYKKILVITISFKTDQTTMKKA